MFTKGNPVDSTFAEGSHPPFDSSNDDLVKAAHAHTEVQVQPVLIKQQAQHTQLAPWTDPTVNFTVSRSRSPFSRFTPHDTLSTYGNLVAEISTPTSLTSTKLGWILFIFFLAFLTFDSTSSTSPTTRGHFGDHDFLSIEFFRTEDYDTIDAAQLGPSTFGEFYARCAEAQGSSSFATGANTTAVKGTLDMFTSHMDASKGQGGISAVEDEKTLSGFDTENIPLSAPEESTAYSE